jgi:WD40 repeat protein
MGSFDGGVTVVDLADGTLRSWPVFHVPLAKALSFSPDGGLVVAGGADRTVRVVHVAHGDAQLVGRLDADVTDTLFTPDGSRVVGSDRDGMIHVWDLAAVPAPLDDAAAVRRAVEGATTARLDEHGILTSP